jgi:hypothetical protein
MALGVGPVVGAIGAQDDHRLVIADNEDVLKVTMHFTHRLLQGVVVTLLRSAIMAHILERRPSRTGLGTFGRNGQ